MYIKYLSNSHNIYENGLLLLSIIFFKTKSKYWGEKRQRHGLGINWMVGHSLERRAEAYLVMISGTEEWIFYNGDQYF